MRVRSGLRISAASAAFLICTTDGAMSQLPSQQSPYPLNDIAVTLSSGTVVRIRNIVIFRSQRGSRLTVYVETPTPSTERARVAVEAKEIAGFQVRSAPTANPMSVRVVVCRTRGCLEMREIPREMFSFIRQSDGSWQPEERPDSIESGDERGGRSSLAEPPHRTRASPGSGYSDRQRPLVLVGFGVEFLLSVPQLTGRVSSPTVRRTFQG